MILFYLLQIHGCIVDWRPVRNRLYVVSILFTLLWVSLKNLFALHALVRGTKQLYFFPRPYFRPIHWINRTLLCDFNEMLHVSEKIGGVPLSASKLYRLNNFLSTCKAHDANLIYEKPERVIIREDCLQLFPNYCVTKGPFTCSDHSYVYLDTESIHPPKKGTTFRYQHSWAQYQEMHFIKLEIICSWHVHVSARPKLKKVKLELKSWSKSTFGNFKHKLQRNANKLLHVEQKLVA
ncbi:LOW QUALITY PROTEIN: hypothetical protein Cgig2_022053 [Carnegiea gigantea]|uniref:Uncharacterized protein n=1 Tax=Carnegiea gigantea TaxID=171969 RepID=A0A9Q1QQA9_9CARY|nr:LOW QUALITY PROTEIN: hypothetical protein Cgig2_022053 [Carnegiea gigantea]